MPALLLLDAAALAALAAWPAHLPLQLLLYIGAGLAWLAAAYRPRAWPRWLLVPALVVHVAALAWPPRHSDDYHRYLWDGAVQRAGSSPYAHPPEDEALRLLRDADFAAMNNRRLPTIYPPGAQLYSWPFKIVREGTETMQAQFVILDDLWSLFSLGTFVRMRLNTTATPTASRP